MKVFITGVAGTLGSVLKDKLREQGHDVWGCDLTHSADPQIVRGDITERRQLKAALDAAWYSPHVEDDGLDIIFHLAAEFGRANGEAFYEQLFRTNLTGTQNVIEECVSRGIRMVFASSSEAYGISEVYANGSPLFEGMLDTYSPQFHNLYSLTKFTNEKQITMAVRNQGLKAIILRFFNIYGPPERYSPYRSVVCQLAYKMLAGLPITVNKGGFRTHLWIGDWATAVSNIADEYRLERLDNGYDNFPYPGSGFTPSVPVFNIGSHEYESIESLYEKLKEIIPDSKSIVSFVDKEEANTPTKRPATGLAEAKLGYTPLVPLKLGLRYTVDWMRETYGF